MRDCTELEATEAEEAQESGDADAIAEAGAVTVAVEHAEEERAEPAAEVVVVGCLLGGTCRLRAGDLISVRGCSVGENRARGLDRNTRSLVVDRSCGACEPSE